MTAQLLYEIGDPAYLNPDVIAHFDTIRLEQIGPDRVALTGTRGSPPPDTLKVALNMLGGYRNTTTMVLIGLDIERKAEHAVTLLTGLLGGTEQFDEFDVRLLRFDHPNAPTNEQATAHLRVTVKDQDESKVGRAFSNAAMELALAGYAGFTPPARPPPRARSASTGPPWSRPPSSPRRCTCRTDEPRSFGIMTTCRGPRPGSRPDPSRPPSPPAPARTVSARTGTSRSGGCAARGPATRAATPTWACGPPAPAPTPGCAST